ncbi:MAG: hypothetical protein E4H10_15580 [Bacteroidia bacterium]|nr:MAG: hypothetical protein E4H10_15580 [Bacteroidia bacterium]
MSKILLFLVLVLFLSPGCSLWEDKNNEKPVARVFEHYLYPSDLVGIIPLGTSPQDSALAAKRYIDTWVKGQLMQRRAEQSLTEEQMDFNRQIEEYHRSLLIFSYKQLLVQQKLDTMVSQNELLSYYQENTSNFLLSEDVIKGTFVKVPLSAPRIAELRGWSWNNREQDLDQMEKYCLSYAEKFSNFNDTWIYFSTIKEQLPFQIPDPSRYLRNRNNAENTDSAYRYFLHITDHLTVGEVSPLEMVAEDITNILLNKRKFEFLQELEHRVYSDGVTRNQFEIYE